MRHIAAMSIPKAGVPSLFQNTGRLPREQGLRPGPLALQADVLQEDGISPASVYSHGRDPRLHLSVRLGVHLGTEPLGYGQHLGRHLHHPAQLSPLDDVGVQPHQDHDTAHDRASRFASALDIAGLVFV